MATYQITRSVEGWSEDELQAAGMRAETCVGSFEGLRWLRSFRDAAHETVTCYYEASDRQSIRDHSAVSEMPCDDIREVEEFRPLLPEPAS